jgi:hypothetical protein
LGKIQLTLAELIRDITPETVATQAFCYIPNNWSTYPDLTGCLRTAGYLEEELNKGFSINRQQLKELFAVALVGTPAQTPDWERLSAAIALVPIWGYPDGVAGRGNRLPIIAVHKHRNSLARAVADFTLNPAETVQILNATIYPNIGLSTLSKLLYFGGLVSAEGPLLIYDQMVMRALHHCQFEEYGKWPSYSGIRQRQTYAGFIQRTATAARRLGVTPEVIEYALFKEGRRLGKNARPPGRDEATAELPVVRRQLARGDKQSVGPIIDSRLPTFGGRTTFSAELYSNGDIRLRYGAHGTKLVEREVFEKISDQFEGTAIHLTSQSGPSLNAWLLEHFSRTRLASYVGAVLIQQGYAVREGDMLRFPDRRAQ